MNNLIKSPQSGHEYLAETLQRIAADPGQFVAEGYVEKSNAPSERYARLTLLGYNESKIRLIYDLGAGFNKCRISVCCGSVVDKFEGLAQFAFAANCTQKAMRESLVMISNYLNDLTLDTDQHAVENAESAIMSAISAPLAFINTCWSTDYSRSDKVEAITLNSPGCQLYLIRSIGSDKLLSITASKYGASESMVNLGSLDAIKSLCMIDPRGDSEFVNIGIHDLLTICVDRQVASDQAAGVDNVRETWGNSDPVHDLDLEAMDNWRDDKGQDDRTNHLKPLLARYRQLKKALNDGTLSGVESPSNYLATSLAQWLQNYSTQQLDNMVAGNNDWITQAGFSADPAHSYSVLFDFISAESRHNIA